MSSKEALLEDMHPNSMHDYSKANRWGEITPSYWGGKITYWVGEETIFSLFLFHSLFFSTFLPSHFSHSTSLCFSNMSCFSLVSPFSYLILILVNRFFESTLLYLLGYRGGYPSSTSRHFLLNSIICLDDYVPAFLKATCNLTPARPNTYAQAYDQ